MNKNNTKYQKAHLLVECWSSSVVYEQGDIHKLFQEVADEIGANLLAYHDHLFETTQGLTAVGLLSTSHISFHSWPEENYIALDVFSCSPYNVDRVKALLTRFLKPQKITFNLCHRGDAHDP